MSSRQPLGATNNGAGWGGPFGSPTKLGGAPRDGGDWAGCMPGCSPGALEREARAVIDALEAESPPVHQPAPASSTLVLAASGSAAGTPVGAGPPPPLTVDTQLIQRLASDVAAADDVVAAWEQVEALRRELRHKDAELASALEALAAAQAAESPGTLARHRETAGQQLARFLKDQLAARDAQLAAAAADAAAARGDAEQRGDALAASEAARRQLEERCTQLEAELLEASSALEAVQATADQQAHAAAAARQGAEEARHEAQQLRSQLWALEARANLASYGTPEATGLEEPEGSISLQHPGTSYHSAGTGGGDAAVDGPAGAGEEEADLFDSPMLRSLRAEAEGRASSSPAAAQHVQQQAAQRPGRASLAVAPSSRSFQFVSVADGGAAAEDDDAASSGGESEVTVSEAAVVARTLTRASALQKDREQLRAQVRDLSTELRDLKGKQKSMAAHMQAAAAEGDSGALVSSRLPLGPRDAAAERASSPAPAGGQARLAEQCRLAVVEERHLRSENDMLGRKCDKLNEMMLKASHAMKVLHHKLIKERKSVARLQEEKCALQAQLLSGGGGGVPPSQQQLAALLGELAAGRARIESLLEEKAMLAGRLQAVAAGGGCPRAATPQQREAASATLVALQEAAEAAAAELRQELTAERARSGVLAEERASLEARLQEVLGRLGAAEQIQGHLEQMNAYLQEERQHCQQLASALGAEQQGSESRAAEAARLGQLAQQATDELLEAREAAAEERRRAEQLARERAELRGRVEALQSTLGRLDRADDVVLRLTEEKAALALEAHDARVAAATAASTAEEHSGYAMQVEATCSELRRQLDAAAAQQEVAHAAVEAAADQLQALTDSHEELERQLEASLGELEAVRAEAERRGAAAAHAEQQAAALSRQLHSAVAVCNSTEGYLQEARRAAAASAAEAAEAREQAARAAARAAAADGVHAIASAKLEALRCENSGLKESIKALRSECEAVRMLGGSVDQTNQTLVDNMCGMSGLVDAVSALQQRNRQLEEDLDSLKAKHAELQRGHEAQSRALAAARDEAATAESEAAAAGEAAATAEAARASVRQELDVERAALAQAQVARDAAVQQREAAAVARGELQERLAAAEASMDDSRQAAAAAAARHEEEAAEAAQLRARLADAEAAVAAAAADRVEAAAARGELQGELEALRKAAAVAEGKLVLAQQRETQFKEASKQLKVLQRELASFVAEGQAHQEAREAAEQRCKSLEARCAELENSAQDLGAQLAAAHEAHEAAAAANAATQQQLADTQLAVAQLQQQQETFQSVQQRLSELETEHHTSGEWFDALTAELADKTDQLAAAGLKLAAAEQAATEAAQALEAAQYEAASQSAARRSAEATAAEAQAAAEAAQTALEAAQAALAERDEQLETAEAMAADTSVQLVAAQEGMEAAEASASEARDAADAAQRNAGELQQRLAAAAAGVEEQHRRCQQLYRGLFFMAAVHEAEARQQTAAAASAAAQHAADLAAAEQRHVAALAAAEEDQAAAVAAQEEEMRQAAGAASKAHRAEVDGLHAELRQLMSHLEAATSQHHAAAERCTALEGELASATVAGSGLEQQLGEAQEALAAATAVAEAASQRHAAAAAGAAMHERHAQQLEAQCSLLRQQLSFLQDQQLSDTDASSALKAALLAANSEAGALRGQLAEAQRAAHDADAERQRLAATLDAALQAQREVEAAAEAARRVVEQREAELQQELVAQREAAAQRDLQLQHVSSEASDAGAAAESLRCQLEAEEDRRRAAEAALDAAAEERQRLVAKVQVHDALEALSSQLQAQMQLLQRIEGTAAADGAPPVDRQAALVARHDLLTQALDKLQALKAENGQLWGMLEEHLASAPGGSSGSGDSGGAEGSRPNQYVEHLEAERASLADQLAAARREHAGAAERLAAAQAAIGKLQAVVQRLSAAGGGPSCGLGLPGLDAGLLLPAGEGAACAGHQASPQTSGGAPAGSAGASEAEAWGVEKRLLKAICKLALAVTMDQVGGRQEAGALADELSPLVAAHAAALRRLGLHKVWDSLHKLAVSGVGAAGAASRASQATTPAEAAAAAATPGALATAGPEQLPADVWALQQRVEQYRTKCKQLKAKVVAMEGAAARWQSQAGEVEQGLALLRFRLADLLSEVKWVLEDYSETEGADGDSASQQLNWLVEQLSKGLRRVLRRHRTLLAALPSSDLSGEEEAPSRKRPAASQQQQQQQQQQQRWDQQPAWRQADQEASSGASGASGARASASAGSGSWGIGAARPAGAASEAMAEAGRKAASIADKLDRLLTPNSRAAVHGGGGSGAGAHCSRFAAEAAEEAAALAASLEGHGFTFTDNQLWAGDPGDEVPLRQRFASGC